MTPKEVHKCANDAYQLSRGLLINPNVFRSDSTVSYGKRRKIYHPQVVDLDFVAQLESEFQYSYQTIDHSIVQMHYEFLDDVLVGAELAFFGATPIETDGDVCPWVRVDYAPTEATGITHPPCHMHTMLGPDVRIPLSGVPGPTMFVDFLLRMFHRKQYETNFMQGASFRHEQRQSIVRVPRLLDHGDDDTLRVLFLAVPRYFKDEAGERSDELDKP